MTTVVEGKAHGEESQAVGKASLQACAEVGVEKGREAQGAMAGAAIGVNGKAGGHRVTKAPNLAGCPGAFIFGIELKYQPALLSLSVLACGQHRNGHSEQPVVDCGHIEDYYNPWAARLARAIGLWPGSGSERCRSRNGSPGLGPATTRRAI